MPNELTAAGEPDAMDWISWDRTLVWLAFHILFSDKELADFLARTA